MPRRLVIPWIFYALAGGLFYFAGAILLFAFSGIMLSHGKIVHLPVVHAYQRAIYFDGLRTDWNCAEYDEDLIYRPQAGECKFDSIEFKTVEHFDAQGRVSHHKTAEIGIAVLGDSHAMGYGVDDDDTFAAQLEEKIGRPVYNLAVASYATYRELLRLEKSGLADRVDTIIIQYCDNDLSENLTTEWPASAREMYGKAFKPQTLLGSRFADVLWSFVRDAFAIPFEEAWLKLFPRGRDFSMHHAGIVQILEKFPALLRDKTVVVFYSNAYGLKFDNFSQVTRASKVKNIQFVDLNLTAEDYYDLDDHLTKAGHRKIAEELFDLLRNTLPPTD